MVGTSVIDMHLQYIYGVFTQPLILIQWYEAAFCFDGESNRLTGFTARTLPLSKTISPDSFS